MTSPLRPELYRRLEGRFGPVKIANEGEEMICRVVFDPEEGRLRLDVNWPGEYYRIACPFCNDGRNRLWINHRWALPVPELKSDNLWLAVCYNENCLAYANNRRALRDRVFSDVVNGRFRDPVLPGERRPPDAREAKPPGRSILMHHLGADHPAKLYLCQRGFDADWLGRNLEVGYCPVSDREFPLAGDRIIIPVIQHGLFMGWQARCIGEPWGDQPKYWTMPGMRKSQLLYNFDTASKSTFVVISEGPTDVWSFGPEAVALFGKSISGPQTRLVLSTWHTVIVLLDGDAFSEAVGVYDALRAVPNRVIVTLPKGTDPGTCDRESLRECVFEAAKRQGIDLGTLATAAP
jgi:hypothetical protein